MGLKVMNITVALTKLQIVIKIPVNLIDGILTQ